MWKCSLHARLPTGGIKLKVRWARRPSVSPPGSILHVPRQPSVIAPNGKEQSFQGGPGYSHCQPLFFSIEKSTQLLKRILRGFPSSGSRLAIRSRPRVLCRPRGHPRFPLSLAPQDSPGWMLQAGPPLSEENTTSGVCYTIAHSQLEGNVQTPFSYSLQQPAGNGSPVK